VQRRVRAGGSTNNSNGDATIQPWWHQSPAPPSVMDHRSPAPPVPTPPHLTAQKQAQSINKHRQKQAQDTSSLMSTLEALVVDYGIILLGYQLRSPETDELFWELCQIVSGNWDQMLVPGMSFAGKSLALVDGNVWRQLEEGIG
jgi:hypothetical protein